MPEDKRIISTQILSEIYNIDYNLPLDKFMIEYFDKIEQHISF